jgi:DNA/RNA-binding domain of Phe-tRNA-synthetase-like protein
MLTIDAQLDGVKLGLVEMEGARVELVVPALAQEMDAVCERIRGETSVEQVAQLDSVRGVRRMFQGWGLDPTRYRPSSEALLRRVTQGKGLYRISNVVDVCNLGSIETGWPYGLYDTSKLQPPITLRLGQPGESYEGIGKQTWHLEGKPVLVDVLGAFGSPISDSTRSMIRESTQAVFAVLYAPAGSAEADVQRAQERFAERLTRYAGARLVGMSRVGG